VKALYDLNIDIVTSELGFSIFLSLLLGKEAKKMNITIGFEAV
jgi:hypothetical protein